MKLAVIPARGGSKRIPRKNIREFCGKPIIAWSIEAALTSGRFDRVVVSTEDPEIAEVARTSGAEVPFMRPAELSDDNTPTVPVIAHAIEWYEAYVGQSEAKGVDGKKIDNEAIESACCIYATAPFCRPEDLREGQRMLEEIGTNFVFPVVRYGFPIQRALRITADGCPEMFQPEHGSTRSQDLEPAYHDAGQWYWGRREAWLEGRPIFAAASRPLVLSAHRVQDIDTLEDWTRAQLIFQALAGQ